MQETAAGEQELLEVIIYIIILDPDDDDDDRRCTYVSVHWSQGLWLAGSTDILKYRVSSFEFRYCVFLTTS